MWEVWHNQMELCESKLYFLLLIFLHLARIIPLNGEIPNIAISTLPAVLPCNT